ncbi:MAG: NUDIX hydrolase [bacterium]
MIFAPIQKQIIAKLINNKQLRYSELQLSNVEPDLFNYHLQHLVKKGILDKADGKYSLSVKGLNETNLFDVQGVEYEAIRNSILLYIIDYQGKIPLILIQKHNRQPYQNDVKAGIAGKIKKGELVADAAKRKLLEETGLSTKTVSYLGTLRKIRTNQQLNFLDDGLFHVCLCLSFQGELITSSKFGDNYWGTFEEALALQKHAKSLGTKNFTLLQKILAKDYAPFNLEEVIPITELDQS